MTLTIKLVRHGESFSNTGAVQSWEAGDHSIRVTPRGLQQAHEAGTGLGAEFLFGALICTSPYRRAHETLGALLTGAGVAPERLSVWEDPRLREVEHGYADVSQQQELRNTHGAFFYRFDRGESPADCFDRTSGFLESLMRETKRRQIERVLIVTHGLTIRCFVMRFFHLTVEQFGHMKNPANCDVITISKAPPDGPVQFSANGWMASGVRLAPTLVPIDRERARQIALKEILRRGLGTGVSRVAAPSEVGRAPTLYGGPDLERCWTVYAATSQQPLALRSSTIIMIDRDTGAVIYVGPANDEG